MSGILRYLTLFVLLLPAFLPQKSYACGLNDADAYFFEHAIVTSEKRDKCTFIEFHFPKEIPSRENWVWSGPWVTFEAQGMHFNLDIANGGEGKESLQSVFFCLPEDVVQEAVINIEYEEYPTEKPVHNENGVTMTQVSFCNHTVVIDNLDELIAQVK